MQYAYEEKYIIKFYLLVISLTWLFGTWQKWSNLFTQYFLCPQSEPRGSPNSSTAASQGDGAVRLVRLSVAGSPVTAVADLPLNTRILVVLF